MNKKIVTVILVLALIILGGGFWYFKKQHNIIVKNKDAEKVLALKDKIELEEIDTSNWQIYRNEEYGFELKYPNNWIYSEPKDGYMHVGNEITECQKVPDGCPIVVLFNQNMSRNFDAVSIDVAKRLSKDLENIDKKNSMWSVGMLSGCHITAKKILENKKEFFFNSFYEATDLNNEEQTKFDISICESNALNPNFGEIFNSLIVSNNIE